MPISNKLSKFAARIVPLERITEAVTMCESNHAQIHAGLAYSVFHRIANLGSGAYVHLALELPARSFLHFQLATLTGSGSADLDMLQDTTFSDVGSVLMTPSNRNRISAQTSVVVFKSYTTPTTLGTLLDGDSLYGSSAKAATGKASDENEWVFSKETSLYHFRILSGQAGWNGIFKAFWYEEGAGYSG